MGCKKQSFVTMATESRASVIDVLDLPASICVFFQPWEIEPARPIFNQEYGNNKQNKNNMQTRTKTLPAVVYNMNIFIIYKYLLQDIWLMCKKHTINV